MKAYCNAVHFDDAHARRRVGRRSEAAVSRSTPRAIHRTEFLEARRASAPCEKLAKGAQAHQTKKKSARKRTNHQINLQN